ncbi:MAG: hypothetical protein KDC70_00635 [Saprospiraceae bacterium]|nr:hypothetical protein [Saprospiraceae bacterium]
MKIKSIFRPFIWKSLLLAALLAFVNNACKKESTPMPEGAIESRITLNSQQEYIDYLVDRIEKCKAEGTAFVFEDEDGNKVENPDRAWLEAHHKTPIAMLDVVQERSGPGEPPPPCTEAVWASITVTGPQDGSYAGGLLRVFKSSTNFVRGSGMLNLPSTYSTPSGSTTMSTNTITYNCDGWCNDYRLTLDGVPQPTSIVITIFHQYNNGTPQMCVTTVTVPNANVGFNSMLIRSLCFCGFG